jgi:NTE family protein
VSGGSLVTGLIYALNGFSWPTSQDYIEHIVPKARELLATHELQSGLFRRVLRPDRIFGTKADDLSALLREGWGVSANLADLTKHPRWMINTTCYQTGKNWRFERFRMGDYVFGYSYDTQTVPLCDAVAASAGFPGLIGPLVFDTRPYKWFKYVDGLDGTREPGNPAEDLTRTTEDLPGPTLTRVHLWDGGVYDNHGLEALHDFRRGWRQGIDFLIVSDAAGRPEPERYSVAKALMRIMTDIMMDQVRSLRSRAVLERMINHDDRGGFFQTGNTCEYVLRAAGKEGDIAKLCPDCLDEDAATRAAEIKTEIKLTREQCDLLFRHGFEVADYTLYAYNEDEFAYVGYSNSRWGK